MTTELVERVEALPANVPESRHLSIDMVALADKALALGPDGAEAFKAVLAEARGERDRAARIAYDDAMVLVQRSMPQIYKDGENTDNRSRYAKLEQVDRHLRPLYTEHGFRITFSTEPCEQEGWITHVGTVTHTGGHVEIIRMPLPIDNKGPKGGATKTEMHGVGSAMSYAQRRITMMAFGAVATGEDDDGQGASKPEPLEPVTQEQADTLRQHALELFVDPGKFLEICRVDTFAAIPAIAYAGAMQRIEARRAWLAEHPEKAEALAAKIATRDAR